jgi:hypothetical protein
MGAMVVEVGPEIEQFILQICTRPEQHGIQIFASNGAKCHLQDPQIGLPWVELKERIMVGAEVLWQPALTSNGALNMRQSATPSTVLYLADRMCMQFPCK